MTTIDSSDVGLTSNEEIRRRSSGTVNGIISLGFGLAVGELVAALINRHGPIVVIGDEAIDRAPASVRRFAITTFGTADKAALVLGIIGVLIIFAAVVGNIAVRRFPIAAVATIGLGAVGIAAGLDGRDGSFGNALPTALAAVAGLVALAATTRRPIERTAGGESASGEGRPGTDGQRRADVFSRVLPDRVDRRQLLGFATVALGATAAAGAGLRQSQRSAKATTTRKALTLPSVAQPLPPVASGASAPVPGLTPFVTPNSSFYRIDTALVVPRVDVNNWELRIGGLVDRPLQLTYDQLLAKPMIEHDCTIMCVSNEIGGDLIGNARWQGVPLAALLEEAGLQRDATQIVGRSVDGWTAGFRTALATDGRKAMVALAMNGEPLPFRHGFPARLIVPGIYGYVSATKWLSAIELFRWEDFDGYWVPRGWSKEGPIKTGSRIDVPRRGQDVRAGTVPIAGVAWAQHRGITKVEVQVDDEPWQQATLADDGGIDTWRQWSLRWNATPGRHSVRVRATDVTGETQTEERADVAPNGATGWHQISVNVRS